MSTTTVIHPEDFRKNIGQKLLRIMQTASTDACGAMPIRQEGSSPAAAPPKLWGEAECIVFATNLEIGIFNYSIREAIVKKTIQKWDNPLFVQIYKDRLRSVFENIRRPCVMDRVLADKLAPQALAFASHQDMDPERWNEMLDAKMKRDISKYVNNTRASTDMFTCRKCRSKECTHYELQTRSADEPMTVFISCLSCGKNWRQ